jgi:Ca2+-transporting ATPase
MSDFHQQTIDEALNALESRREGLGGDDAGKRLEKHGPNELQEKGIRSPWAILLEQFAQTMVIILIVAAIISAFLGDWLEAGAILAIVILFATLGFVQDYRADRAMAALREMAVPEVRVRRGGEDRRISSKELVPGDVVYLEAGNVVPADLRLIEANDLRIDEAALTGESEPVEKSIERLEEADSPLGDRTNMAYSGTVVSGGRGLGVVARTGMATEMGHIASMIQEDEGGRTPMQTELDRVGKILAAGGVAVAIVVALVGFFLLGLPMREMFLVAVSLAVAVVPEGLPAVVTMTLSLGSQRMLKRNSLVRKLPAVETLGSVTVICTDKTGTLTQNRMTATELRVPGEPLGLAEFPEPKEPERSEHDGEAFGKLPERIQLLVAGGVLCNDAGLTRNEETGRIDTVGDPTEGALRLAASRVGLSGSALAETMERVRELSFDSDRKRMTTFHRVPEDRSGLPGNLSDLIPEGTGCLAVTKGAVDGLLDIGAKVWAEDGPVALDEDRRKSILSENESLTRKGMRVLGLAVRFWDSAPDDVDTEDEADLTFVGFFGLIDPPRPEVKEAVKQCRTAGIRPIMITGDHPLTALSIAQDLGITNSDRVLTGKELGRMSERELAEAVRETSVFARVSPEHKLNIVDALQANGEICSMTGDGVNDAPALKRADIGVAMGITGTDVSKEASDMVLLDDNYATIVAAVEEGRVIGDNVRRFVKYSIAGNIGKVIVMMFAPIFGISLALMPLQLLWLNLITDGLLGLGMSVEPPDPHTMDRPPRAPDEGVFSRGGVAQVFLVGTVIGAVALGVGAWYHQSGDGAGGVWQSMIFTLIAFLQVGQALAMRSDRESFFTLGATTNLLMLWMCLGIVALQIILLYVPFLQTFFKTTPLGPVELIACAGFGTIAFIVVEAWKGFRRSGTDPEERKREREKMDERLEAIQRKLSVIDERLKRLEGEEGRKGE